MARILIWIALLVTTSACAGASRAERLPNIVLILADDLGYGDVGAYNPHSKIPTPHIDRLAGEGIRLTDAHSGSTCVPSRYALLTGRYLFRTSRSMKKDALIEPGRLTVASLLKRAGYATAMIGKWHLGFENHGLYPDMLEGTGPLRGGPVDHGFDVYFGIPASLDIGPYIYIEHDRAVEAPTEHIEPHRSPGRRFVQGEFWRSGRIAPGFRHKEVLPRLTDRAVDYLQDRAASRQPFFLYLALTAPHTPWLPGETFRGKSGAGPYGDFVAQVDAVVGRVMAALEKAGKGSDTLVVFTSDNGPTWYAEDVEQWGHRSAGEWRGMKADAWEGGHRMPFIARWPGRIPAGALNAQPVSFTDLLATVARLTGQELPRGSGEDSLNMLPALLGERSKPGRQQIVHEAMGADGTLLAVRQGDWKLIPSPCTRSAYEGSAEFPNWCTPGREAGQLYNLAEDPGERKNVYAEHPEIVRELTRRLQLLRGRPDGASTQ